MIERTIPGEDSRTRDPEQILLSFAGREGLKVLDLGCGDGTAVDLVKQLGDATYTGVDIEVSPEVRSRTREDACFVTYDGVSLPFADASFDIVYSRQVFEHIRYPDTVAAEVYRVLKPGGAFIGSLSYLEPYHSFSIFNFTPYGVFRLLEDNGLRLRSMWPGAEGLSLMVRQMTKRRVGRLRLAYPLIDVFGAVARWDHKKRNYLKLRFAGHITFFAYRPTAAAAD